MYILNNINVKYNVFFIAYILQILRDIHQTDRLKGNMRRTRGWFSLTWRQTLSSTRLHQLGIGTDGFAQLAQVPDLIKNIKVWIIDHTTLW